MPVVRGGGAETQAAYRRLDNDALDGREVLEAHTRRTGGRLQGHPVVVCIQATTAWAVTRRPGMAGWGRLSDEAQQGR